MDDNQNLVRTVVREVLRELRTAPLAPQTEWMTPEEAARYCGLDVRQLSYMRWHETPGPKAYKPTTKIVRYKRSDLDAWMSGADYANLKGKTKRGRAAAAA